jgi:hypothetical protein
MIATLVAPARTTVRPVPAPPRAAITRPTPPSAEAEKKHRKRPDQTWKKREAERKARRNGLICDICAQEGAKEVTLGDGLVRVYCKPCELA